MVGDILGSSVQAEGLKENEEVSKIYSAPSMYQTLKL